MGQRLNKINKKNIKEVKCVWHKDIGDAGDFEAVVNGITFAKDTVHTRMSLNVQEEPG